MAEEDQTHNSFHEVGGMAAASQLVQAPTVGLPYHLIQKYPYTVA